MQYRRLCQLSAVAAIGATLAAFSAQAAVTVPACAALDPWAAKYDQTKMWTPNAIGSRTQIPALFAAPETAALFKAPLVAWTVADATAIRDAVLACRRATKDRALSSAYNGVQSGLINRVANFAKDVAQARPRVAQAMAALQTQTATLPLLRFQAALGHAATAKGYGEAQQATQGLSGPPSTAARELLTAMRDLPQAELEETIVKPSAARATAMRADVIANVIADLQKAPATGDGLAMLNRVGQTAPTQYGGALGADGLAAVQKAVAERREAVAAEIATTLVAQIGQSSQGDDGFADIDRRAQEAFLPNLPPAQAARVRDAAQARRQALADTLFKDMSARLAALPETDASLHQVNGALAGIGAWPASAAAFKPKFQELTQARRAAILAAVNKAEAGPLRGRLYASQSGRLKLEFVDATRVFATQGGATAAGTYTEEKDGRVVLAINQQSWVMNREGRQLTGWVEPLARTK